MISIDKLRAVKHLITHANCPDGIASALIVKDALPDVRVSFMSYGMEEHKKLEPAPGVLFCDFTPWLPKLTDPRAKIVCEDGRVMDVTDKGVLALRDELVKQWREAGVIILDHHPTAKDIVEAFGENGIFGENERGECGAWLAFQHVWSPLAEIPKRGRLDVADFARLAAIRDTWQKGHPRWREACEQAAALLFWPFEYLSEFGLGRMVGSNNDVGPVLFDKQLSAARKSIDEAHRFTTKRGTRVLMFQGVSTTSDAAEILEKPIEEGVTSSGTPYAVRYNPVSIVAGFHYRMSGGKLQLQFSTRSHTGYDVSALAKAHGGGGHKAAAGFTVEVSPEIGANPYAVFRLLLSEFEEGL